MNLLEQLREQHVPAPPPQLRQEVRSRMNTTLLALHFTDLLLRGVPFALLHFGQAFAGAVAYTLTGTYEPKTRDDARLD